MLHYNYYSYSQKLQQRLLLGNFAVKKEDLKLFPMGNTTFVLQKKSCFRF